MVNLFFFFDVATFPPSVISPCFRVFQQPGSFCIPSKEIHNSLVANIVDKYIVSWPLFVMSYYSLLLQWYTNMSMNFIILQKPDDNITSSRAGTVGPVQFVFISFFCAVCSLNTCK